MRKLQPDKISVLIVLRFSGYISSLRELFIGYKNENQQKLLTVEICFNFNVNGSLGFMATALILFTFSPNSLLKINTF